jgi:predicted enzyme related to lactoylglutathione lyase
MNETNRVGEERLRRYEPSREAWNPLRVPNKKRKTMSKRSRIVHVEWRSRNVDRLRQFYKSAFRWKFKDPMPGYSVADMGSKESVGGFMQIDAGSPLQQGIVAFLGSDDLASSEAAIREAGGQIVASSQPVEGWGRFTVFTDPDGNQLALWQSEESVKRVAREAKKSAKKAEAARADAERAELKARKKAEKKAAKAARKAEKKAQKQAQAAKAGAEASKAERTAEQGKANKKDKKKKKKSESSSAEAGGAL